MNKRFLEKFRKRVESLGLDVAVRESIVEFSDDTLIITDKRTGLMLVQVNHQNSANAFISGYEKAQQILKLHPIPIDMLLFCPNCGSQHIDAPQPEKDWTNPPHRSHECQFCNWVWRPADVPTNGVEKLQTEGKRDGKANPCPIAVRRMSENNGKVVVVDVNDFEERLNLQIREDDEWNWTINHLFEEVEVPGQTEEHFQLSNEGIDKIVGAAAGILEDLHDEQIQREEK